MLSFFRKGGVGQAIVAAIAIGVMAVFILEFRSGRGGGGSLRQECAIEAFGDCVSPKDYNASFGLVLYRLQIQPKKIRELGIRKQVLEGIVERELLLREAARLGVAVSEDEIDQELLNGRAHVSLPASSQRLAMQLGLCLPNEKQTSCQAPPDLVRILPVKSAQSGQFDTKIYERILRSSVNRGPKEFKEMQRRELIAARMRNLVRSRVRVSEGAAWLDFERDNARAIVRTVQIKRDWLAKWAVDVSDAATDRWAFEHKDQVDEE
jgi:peptidyl-prolyl cis-trans isomerase D